LRFSEEWTPDIITRLIIYMRYVRSPWFTVDTSYWLSGPSLRIGTNCTEDGWISLMEEIIYMLTMLKDRVNQI